MLQADKQAEEHVQQQLCGQSESWQSVPLQLGCSIGSQQDRFAVQKDRLPSKSALPSTNTAFSTLAQVRATPNTPLSHPSPILYSPPGTTSSACIV